MDQAWLDAAMARARFDVIENDPPHYGEIPDCSGVWAVAADLEACRVELRSVLEEWAEFKVRYGQTVPMVDGATYYELLVTELRE